MKKELGNLAQMEFLKEYPTVNNSRYEGSLSKKIKE